MSPAELSSGEADQLRTFERQGHDALASSYHAFFAQVTALATDHLFDAVHLLAIVVGGVICGIFPKTLVPTGITFPTEFWDKAAYCFLFGILASGGSSFWNSALDTLRNVKTTMAKKDS